jgi:hypothetical protein
MSTETIKFKIELYAQYWDKPPITEILINDNVVCNKQEITSNEDKPTVIEFEYTLEAEKKYTFRVNNCNKDNSQTVIEDDKIIKDQLLFIKSVSIDDIDLGGLIYEAKYYPEYLEPWASEQRSAGKDLPEYIKNVTSMGHNGRWEITFTSPFYMWLLENLY